MRGSLMLMLVAASALAAAHASAQEAPPELAPDQPVVPHAVPAEQAPTHPDYGFMAAGAIVFGVAYLVPAITIASLAADSCSSDPGCAHCTPCEDVPLAFVPFVHFLGGADIIGWLIGIPAIFAEVAGIILFIVGAAHHRRSPAPQPGTVRVGVGALELTW